MKLYACFILVIYAVAETFTGCLSDSSGKVPNEKGNKGQSGTVFELKIHEPSGLSFSASGDALFVVSDRNGAVYRIDFTGAVLEKLPFQGHDLEGIEVDKATGEIWLVEERKQNILHLSSSGELIEKITDVRIETKNNSGFEGVAKNGDIIYILVEDSPGSLIEYNISSKKWDRHKLDFAKDYSGVDYDPSDNTLWIVSHESRTLNHCTIKGKLISGQDIDVKQAEGVAVDRAAKIAWIVSDAGSTLHKITLKDKF
jgi:uncharacterized protein YjiK